MQRLAVLVSFFFFAQLSLYSAPRWRANFTQAMKEAQKNYKFIYLKINQNQNSHHSDNGFDKRLYSSKEWKGIEKQLICLKFSMHEKASWEPNTQKLIEKFVKSNQDRSYPQRFLISFEGEKLATFTQRYYKLDRDIINEVLDAVNQHSNLSSFLSSALNSQKNTRVEIEKLIKEYRQKPNDAIQSDFFRALQEDPHLFAYLKPEDLLLFLNRYDAKISSALSNIFRDCQLASTPSDHINNFVRDKAHTLSAIQKYYFFKVLSERNIPFEKETLLITKKQLEKITTNDEAEAWMTLAFDQSQYDLALVLFQKVLTTKPIEAQKSLIQLAYHHLSSLSGKQFEQFIATIQQAQLTHVLYEKMALESQKVQNSSVVQLRQSFLTLNKRISSIFIEQNSAKEFAQLHLTLWQNEFIIALEKSTAEAQQKNRRNYYHNKKDKKSYIDFSELAELTLIEGARDIFIQEQAELYQFQKASCQLMTGLLSERKIEKLLLFAPVFPKAVTSVMSSSLRRWAKANDPESDWYSMSKVRTRADKLNNLSKLRKFLSLLEKENIKLGDQESSDIFLSLVKRSNLIDNEQILCAFPQASPNSKEIITNLLFACLDNYGAIFLEARSRSYARPAAIRDEDKRHLLRENLDSHIELFESIALDGDTEIKYQLARFISNQATFRYQNAINKQDKVKALYRHSLAVIAELSATAPTPNNFLSWYKILLGAADDVFYQIPIDFNNVAEIEAFKRALSSLPEALKVSTSQEILSFINGRYFQLNSTLKHQFGSIALQVFGQDHPELKAIASEKKRIAKFTDELKLIVRQDSSKASEPFGIALSLFFTPEILRESGSFSKYTMNGITNPSSTNKVNYRNILQKNIETALSANFTIENIHWYKESSSNKVNSQGYLEKPLAYISVTAKEKSPVVASIAMPIEFNEIGKLLTVPIYSPEVALKNASSGLLNSEIKQTLSLPKKVNEAAQLSIEFSCQGPQDHWLESIEKLPTDAQLLSDDVHYDRPIAQGDLVSCRGRRTLLYQFNLDQNDNFAFPQVKGFTGKEEFFIEENNKNQQIKNRTFNRQKGGINKTTLAVGISLFALVLIALLALRKRTPTESTEEEVLVAIPLPKSINAMTVHQFLTLLQKNGQLAQVHQCELNDDLASISKSLAPSNTIELSFLQDLIQKWNQRQRSHENANS